MPGVIAKLLPFHTSIREFRSWSELARENTDRLNVALAFSSNRCRNCAEYRSFRFELLLVVLDASRWKDRRRCIIRAVIPYYLRSHSLQLREVFFCQCEQSTPD